MKKFLLIFVLLGISGMAHASPRLIDIYDPIGPTWVAGSSTMTVTIASVTTPTNAVYCLTQVYATINSTATPSNLKLSIMDLGTTTYVVNASTGQPINAQWNETDPICGQPGHFIRFSVSAPANTGVASIDASYKGYSYNGRIDQK